MSKEIMLELWCELDDAEMLVRGQMLSTVVADYELVETQKKDAMKGFREQLDELWQQRVKLSGIIKRKAETRLVNCAVQFHVPAPGTKRVTRLDTGEFVRDEPMSAAEHQGNLFTPDAPPDPPKQGSIEGLAEADAVEGAGKTVTEFRPRKSAKS